jgi:uncharacterized protein (TIGR03118 family)
MELAMRAEFSLAMGLLLLASTALAGEGAGKAPKFKVTNLVSNQSGKAKVTDPNLVNPWGLSQGPGTDPIWVADNGTGLSTVYDQGTGINTNIVVTIPDGSPTGTVYVPAGTGFEISQNGKNGDAEFLFDSDSGVISGWNGSVNPNEAVVAYTSSTSNYTGLALDPSSELLFATDFANNAVDVFNNSFQLQYTFTDSSLPKGFAPFNAAIINGEVYVAFAQGGGAGKHPKGGSGYVDVFDENGTLEQQLIANGALDAPWGLAIAPSTWGSFAGSLLVGNLDNGKINAYDLSTGKLLGTLADKKGKPIVIQDLWALDAVPSGDITFSAGSDGYADGLLGLISVQK